MKRLSFVWIFSVILVMASLNFAFAQGQPGDGDLDRFTVVIDQLDISRDGGRTWVNIHRGAKTFNMLGIRGGSPTAFATKEVPAGTYNKYRVHTSGYDIVVINLPAEYTDPPYDGNQAQDTGPDDYWESRDMRLVVDAGGNTSATFNFNTDTYVVHGPNDIELNPEVTIR